MSWLRDVIIVAAFDLEESLRSRRVLVLFVLYVLGAVAATIIFTEVLKTIEEELAEQLLVARTEAPATMTQALLESPEVLRILSRLVRDRELAESLVKVPPVALLYGWVALTFGPVLVALTASDAITTEVSTGSIRFALFRTDRSAWAAGKFLGQALLLAVGLLLGGVGAFVTGWINLGAFDPLSTAGWILRYAGTGFVYSFAFLGVALGVSQVTRSVPWARALGIFALASMAGAYGYLTRDRIRDHAPVLIDSGVLVLPGAHRLDLWRPELAEMLPSVVVLIAMGLTYFALGHLRFVRVDT
ncbi:MAG: ABC transporter permease subunit [Myxococcota bacterium]